METCKVVCVAREAVNQKLALSARSHGLVADVYGAADNCATIPNLLKQANGDFNGHDLSRVDVVVDERRHVRPRRAVRLSVPAT